MLGAKTSNGVSADKGDGTALPIQSHLLSFSCMLVFRHVFGGTLMDRLLSFATLKRKAMRVGGDELWRQERRQLERRAKYDVNARRELDGENRLSTGLA